MRVSQNGNTANNGFFNAIILTESPVVEVVGRPSTAGISHAFSQPAWDLGSGREYSNANAGVWTPRLQSLNSRFSDSRRFPRSMIAPAPFEESETTFALELSRSTRTHNESDFLKLLNFFPVGKVRSQNHHQIPRMRLIENVTRLVDSAVRRSARSLDSTVLTRASIDIHITIGNSWPGMYKPTSRTTRSVVLEHGQVRWIVDGPAEASNARIDFRRTCEQSDHLWLTNVDDRTLEIADRLFPDKWSLLPHPYVLDPNAPYSEVLGVRSHLLKALDADFLILNPSSISIGGDQRKGTERLLKALAYLARESKARIGLILVKWGQDIARAETLMLELGIANRCLFIDPIPRVTLQTMMASVDLVTDQFDYDAFGGVTIRALEQGVPLLSRKVGERAAQLMGSPPPVRHAVEIDEIAQSVYGEYERHQTMGRDSALASARQTGRSWIIRNHHHHLTRRLQEERYVQLLEGDTQPTLTGRWGDLVREQSEL